MANYESLVLYDSAGVVLDHLTQWDSGQSILIKGVSTSPLPTVHFKSAGYPEALLVEPTVSGGKLKVAVPNYLLQYEYPIFVYVYYHNADDSSETEYMSVIPVVPRAKPLDFFYVKNIEYPNWFDFKERLTAAEQEVTRLNELVASLSDRVGALESHT